MDNEVAVSRPSWRSVLLGLFVLFQAAYLPISNLIQLVPRQLSKPSGDLDIRVQRDGTTTDVRPLQSIINNLGTAIDRYGELTGQVQAWSLFAADFPTNSVFPVLQFVRADGSQYSMHSRIMPNDPDHYFRWPGSLSRLNSYDYLLAVVYVHYSDESLRERGDEWRDAVRDRVRRQQRTLEAYFRFSLGTFRQLRPDCPTPREIILNVVVRPSPRPGSLERGPETELPLARWFPDREVPAGYLPVEAYDPVAREFIRLPITENDQ